MKRVHFPRYRKSSFSRLRGNSDYKTYLKSKGLLKCQVCGFFDPLTEPFYLIEIHHIRQVTDGGSSTHDNLIALCPTHHNLADRISRSNRDISISKDAMVSLIRDHEFNRDRQIENLNRS